MIGKIADKIGKKTIKPIPIFGDTAFRFGATAFRKASSANSILKEKRFTDTFLLYTMMKSGTQYLKVIISNYLIFQFLGEENRLGFVESDARIWKPEGYTTTLKRLHIATGYKHWKHQHVNPYIRYNNAKVIVHTNRNPLDIIVAQYYFFLKNRRESHPHYVPGFDHPRQAIDRLLWGFIQQHNQIKKISHRTNVKVVTYENLIRNPLDTVKDIFYFANIPVHEDSLQKAIDVCSVDWVRADEKRYKVEGINEVIKTSDHPLAQHMKIGHIRSGKIGEWKEYFNDEDIKKISGILAQNAISLNDFILE